MSATLPTDTRFVPTVPRTAARMDEDSRYWEAAVAAPGFQRLRATKALAVGGLLGASVCYILGLSLMAGYAKDTLALKVAGAFNVGYLLILLTYVLCWGVALAYVRIANGRFDPLAADAIAALPARSQP